MCGGGGFCVTNMWSPLNPPLQCSEVCDQGKKIRNVTCIDTRPESGPPRPVHEEFCRRQGGRKPRPARNCNVQPCPYRWKSSEWSEVQKQNYQFFFTSLFFYCTVFFFKSSFFSSVL